MNIKRLLILIIAAGLGTGMYKYQRAQLALDDPADRPPAQRSTYDDVTGHGSLMESLKEARSSGYKSNGLLTPPNSMGSGALGNVGNPYDTGGASYSGSTGGLGGGSNSIMYSGNESAAPVHLPKDDQQLLEASAKGDKDKVAKRLALHVKVDSRDTQLRTPLMYAAMGGQDEISARLLAAGASLHAEDRAGDNALDYAAGRGLVDSVKFLLSHADSDDDKHYVDYALLIKTAFAGDVSQLPEGKGKLVAVNRISPDGQSPLHIAAGNGSVALAEALIRRGAQVNIANDEGQTPLQWAAWNNQAAMVELLAAKGADLSLADRGGNTPLILAAQNNSRDVIRILLDKGVDKNIANKEGKTAAIAADDKGYKELAKALY